MRSDLSTCASAVRLVGRLDRFPVAAMMLRSWTEAYPPMVPPRRLRRDTARGVDRWFGQRMARRGYRAFMAGQATAPLGVCAICPVRPGLFEIDVMFVAQGRRNNGLGSQLVDHALRAVGRRHAATRLWVGARNQRAQRWYGRHGFIRTGRRSRIPWNGFAWQVDEMRRRPSSSAPTSALP